MRSKTEREIAKDSLAEIVIFLLNSKRSKKNRVTITRYIDKMSFEFSEILMKKFMCVTTLMQIDKYLNNIEPMKTWFWLDVLDKVSTINEDIPVGMYKGISIKYDSERRMYEVNLFIKPEYWDINFVIDKFISLILSKYCELSPSKRLSKVSILKMELESYFSETEIEILTTQLWLYTKPHNKERLERYTETPIWSVHVDVISTHIKDDVIEKCVFNFI